MIEIKGLSIYTLSWMVVALTIAVAQVFEGAGAQTLFMILVLTFGLILYNILEQTVFKEEGGKGCLKN